MYSYQNNVYAFVGIHIFESLCYLNDEIRVLKYVSHVDIFLYVSVITLCKLYQMKNEFWDLIPYIKLGIKNNDIDKQFNTALNIRQYKLFMLFMINKFSIIWTT